MKMYLNATLHSVVHSVRYNGLPTEGEKRMPQSISRRTLLKASASVGGVLAAPSLLRRAWAAEPFTVRVPGGYGNIWNKAFFEPFKKDTGIQAVAVVSKDFPYNEFKISVETGAYRWSMAAGITKELYYRLNDGGYLEPIDTNTPEITSRGEGNYTSNWLPYGLYCLALAYRPESFPNGIKTFRDMWNVASFPGRRALRKRSVDAIEMAARGAGIAPSEIYKVLSTEEGWSRVFDSLQQIRPHIDVWWESDAQMDQLIGSGDLEIFPISSQRAQKLKNDGASITIEYNEGYYTTQGWAIPRGSPHADIAREFIKFASRAECEAEFMKATLMGPMNPRAFELIPPEVARTLPTYPENLSKMVELNAQFWLRNIDKATARFEAWLLKS